MRKLEEYLLAMRYVNDVPEASVYLDLEEDDLLYVDDYSDIDIDELEDDPDRYIFFVSSYDLFDLDIYNEFIERLDGPIRSQFFHAFNGRGKYRRFKDLLNQYQLGDELNAFEERKLVEYIEEWSIRCAIPIDGLVIGNIREIVKEDYEELFTLMKEVYDFHQLHRPDYFIGPFVFTKDQLDWIINTPNYYGVVYEENGKALGYMTYELIEKHETRKCHIHEIGITRKAQGKGFGKKLFQYVEKQAKLNQTKVIELDVFAFNHSAIAFYEAEGMEASKIIYEKKIGD